MTVEGLHGSDSPSSPRDASVSIEKVTRRMNLERELRRGLGRISLEDLETLLATLHHLEQSPDRVESGAYFEGEFGGSRG